MPAGAHSEAAGSSLPRAGKPWRGVLVGSRLRLVMQTRGCSVAQGSAAVAVPFDGGGGGGAGACNVGLGGGSGAHYRAEPGAPA
nr:unnamed protein product [Digitaria exilis]